MLYLERERNRERCRGNEEEGEIIIIIIYLICRALYIQKSQSATEFKREENGLFKHTMHKQ